MVATPKGKSFSNALGKGMAPNCLYLSPPIRTSKNLTKTWKL
jgi:hypothetical protein